VPKSLFAVYSRIGLWHNGASALGDGHLERHFNIRSAAAAFSLKENHEEI
jgi:hypothetical protein